MTIDLNWRPTSYSDFDNPDHHGLPDCLPGEVEIACIVVGSVFPDIISIRARWRSGRYRYRVMGDAGEWVDYCRKSSMKPLTLGQLIDLIQAFDQDEYGNDLLKGLWNSRRQEGCGLEESVDFAHVESNHYSELFAWCQEHGRQWCIEGMEECLFCEKDYDPAFEDSHDCKEKKEEMAAFEVEIEQRKEAWRTYPLMREMQEVFDDWWVVHGSRWSERSRGAGGMGGGIKFAAFSHVAGHILDTIKSTGSMPSGVFTGEFNYLSAETKLTTEVDFTTLADQAKAILKQRPQIMDWAKDMRSSTVKNYFKEVAIFDDPPASPREIMVP